MIAKFLDKQDPSKSVEFEKTANSLKVIIDGTNPDDPTSFMEAEIPFEEAGNLVSYIASDPLALKNSFVKLLTDEILTAAYLESIKFSKNGADYNLVTKLIDVIIPDNLSVVLDIIGFPNDAISWGKAGLLKMSETSYRNALAKEWHQVKKGINIIQIEPGIVGGFDIVELENDPLKPKIEAFVEMIYSWHRDFLNGKTIPAEDLADVTLD